MSELDRSRTAHARLSVAEERLRFARDLHDVLGRNLSLIAVQSELAAELARRGDQDAAGQMLEVRQVAHESLREMRAVVSGYRTADLDTELAGAQDVLRSAGMSCRVIGDAAGLPADVQAALGWVVREGTTNVIRHSDATACTIELHILDSPGAARAVTLRMDNDRVHTPDAGSGGSGLAGLGERLAGLGGSITTGHPRSGHFRLEASLPACGAAAAPPGPGQRGTGVTRRDARAVIRVLLADDENLIRTALASLLAIQDDLEVVAQAASGDEALAMARRYRPDVAVLDLQMPGLDGIAVAEAAGHRAARLRQPHPDQLRTARASQTGPRRRRPRVPAQDRLGPGPGRRGTHRPPRRPLRRPRTRRRRHQRRRQPAHPPRSRRPGTRGRRRPRR